MADLVADLPAGCEADAAAAAESSPSEQLLLVLDGFEGPLDMLLALGRDQKVDLTRISILELADQYLTFVAEARKVRLELAADYLVMAAWLAYLKSRLLLPEPQGEEPSGEDMAAALAFQLQRLEAMKGAAEKLFARPRLRIDVHPRGAPEDLDLRRKSVYEVTLFDLLRAYGRQRARKESGVLHIAPVRLYSMEEAVRRLSSLLGHMPDWAMLASFLPSGESGGLLTRSALAAHFAATLELAKAGRVELRQEGAFAPLYVRGRPGNSADSQDGDISEEAQSHD
ncbi:segregation and condensation protein A [Azospirillum lipoferum]|uniref:Segregation and condensation protein A n=1 Tax=Azospirillum lipoferum TaxID=193 RepID=A0A5A9GM85_AZOLI|nr:MULTISPECIES: ScpA family protein [Azospirillum]KAA0594694.1 segregation/condensation protein A [Azospirillum lipoferum]MCP1612998.1 segregation and condensation protein A [Azospirillum lipoferum]MDW5532811.1 ScpA family protein [Azospirillum sp. NL1]